MTEQQAAETTRRWARFHFKRMPFIRGSLDYLGTNDQERIERVETFGQTISYLNTLLNHPDQITPALADVNVLRENIDGQTIPTLETILNSPEMTNAVARTFEFGKKDFPTWADSDMDSPTKPAMGIFLEGFGYFIGTHIHGNDTEKVLTTKRSIVKSIEEVLAVKHQGSKLLGDVVDWMRDESSDFPQEIQKLLS